MLLWRSSALQPSLMGTLAGLSRQPSVQMAIWPHGCGMLLALQQSISLEVDRGAQSHGSPP